MVLGVFRDLKVINDLQVLMGFLGVKGLKDIEGSKGSKGSKCLMASEVFKVLRGHSSPKGRKV